MSTPAIRFTYGGVNYDFSSEEVLGLKHFSAIERANIFWDLFGNAHLYLLGDGYELFEITFNITSRTAITNLAAIYALVDSDNNPAGLVLYYEYLLNTLSRRVVQMRRDQYEEQYHGGYVKRGGTIAIQFYERYSTPAMEQLLF